MKPYAPAAEQYAAFVAQAGRDSPCFAEWAAGVADDPEVLALIAGLPRIKQQPNLVFAAARWHGTPAPAPYEVLRERLLTDWPRIRETVLARSTQTNEIGRLAVFLPAIATAIAGRPDRPLALVDVGASAGLCLFPDRYAYRWRTEDGDVLARPGTAADGAPELVCRVTGPAPLPACLPPVARRTGVDLHPLDVGDDDATAWLENLVWPEQQARRARLRAAIRLARADPPQLRTGDLVTALPGLVDDVLPGHTTVIINSAAIAYLDLPDRERYLELASGLIRRRDVHWVSYESRHVLPTLTATGPPIPKGKDPFVVAVNGRAVAWAHGHGRWMTWFG